MAALREGRPGDTYLFGGRCEMSNLDVASKLCSLLDARRPRSDGRSYAAADHFCGRPARS